MSYDRRQIRLFAILFLASLGLLSAVWFFLLRTEYVPAYQNIREADASQIVAELENAGIAFRLDNNGHDILVPADQTADARVAVAGANIALGGTTGFELFNENDLGLTEFAQKINLQRAIQGELSRTIMMMDGVEFARVHLALPERTLFRSDQEAPTAAVTIEMQPPKQLSAQSVTGIRQLVASSVPGLTIDGVAVLDDQGSLVSSVINRDVASAAPPSSERAAIEQLLAIRANDAIRQVLPQQPFAVEISAFERVDETDDVLSDEAEQDSPQPDTRPIGLTNRSLRVLVRTPQLLGPEERSAISLALVNAVQLSTSQGDVLDFSTGALTAETADVETSLLSSSASADSDNGNQIGASGTSSDWGQSWSYASLQSYWFVIPFAVLVLIIFAIRPRRNLSEEETENFAELLRRASPELEAR